MAALFTSMEGYCFCSLLQEEQKKLRGTIEEADVMIKSLDDCILELQTGTAVTHISDQTGDQKWSFVFDVPLQEEQRVKRLLSFI